MEVDKYVIMEHITYSKILIWLFSFLKIGVNIQLITCVSYQPRDNLLSA
jgi:hypothetical protein